MPLANIDFNVVYASVQVRGIETTMLACKNSGYAVGDHFAEASKTIKMPKTAIKQVIDCEAFRFPLYQIR